MCERDFSKSPFLLLLYFWRTQKKRRFTRSSHADILHFRKVPPHSSAALIPHVFDCFYKPTNLTKPMNHTFSTIKAVFTLQLCFPALRTHSRTVSPHSALKQSAHSPRFRLFFITPSSCAANISHVFDRFFITPQTKPTPCTQHSPRLRLFFSPARTVHPHSALKRSAHSPRFRLLSIQ